MSESSASPGIAVTILGSGTCVPSLRRSACAALLRAGGQTLLVDVGPGTSRRLMEAGVPVQSVSALLLTHFHPDHSGELAGFLFSNKYAREPARTVPLELVGGRGFSEFFLGLNELYQGWIDLGSDRLRLTEMAVDGPDDHRLGPVRVETRPVNHNPESIAYRIAAPDGASVVLSGDTGPTDALAELAEGADLLICESALPDGMGVPNHLTPSQAGEIATRAGVGKLALTHFYPECDQADVEAQCRRAWTGPLILAEDLLRLDVRKGS
ncbi:MAG: MBL fold metallo-hydrolase [Desulfococcaceae bacterium]